MFRQNLSRFPRKQHPSVEEVVTLVQSILLEKNLLNSVDTLEISNLSYLKRISTDIVINLEKD